MKYFILIFSCCILLTTSISAQNKAPVQSNTFLVSDSGFNKFCTIHITNENEAVFTIDSSVRKIPITITKGLVHLKNKADNQKLLILLNIPESEINQHFKTSVNTNAIEKLLNAAYQSSEHTLHITSTNTSTTNENEILISPEEAEKDQNASSKNWLLYGLGILALGGLVFGIAATFKKKNDKITIEEEPETNNNNPSNTTPVKTKTSLSATQLKEKYNKQKEDIKLLKQNIALLQTQQKELQQQISKDKNYYQAAFTQIINPLQKAIDQGDLANTFKYLTIAAIQYSAITREQLTKRQAYDITNIDTLLNTKTDYNQYPTITKDTTPDKMPNQLKNIVSILQQLGVKNLDNNILQGYNLKDL